MAYHSFKDEAGAFGSFETFYVSKEESLQEHGSNGTDAFAGPGWYWWSCFPGCLPDGDAFGPFETEQEAINAANEE